MKCRGMLLIAALLGFALYVDVCSACRFAELARRTSVEGIAQGRELLGIAVPYLNNNGKAQKPVLLQSPGNGVLKALVEYGMETMPLNVQDLLTTMGSFADAQQMWIDAVPAANIIPAGIDHAVKSLPALLDQMRQLVKTDWSNVAGMEKLDSKYRTIFSTIAAAIDPFFAGLQLRMAFHDCGTYNPNATYKGGANGSLRFEFDWPSHAGMQWMFPSIWAIKQALDDALDTPTSYADLIAISGAAAIYNTDGPIIDVGHGRPDADGPDPVQGVASNADEECNYPIQAIIDEWASYGFTSDELVTLSGGHTIGRSRSTPPEGQLTADMRTFDNHYYHQIIAGTGRYRSDNGLAETPDTYKLAKAYAADNELFLKKFSAAFTKLTWLGVNTSVSYLISM